MSKQYFQARVAKLTQQREDLAHIGEMRPRSFVFQARRLSKHNTTLSIRNLQEDAPAYVLAAVATFSDQSAPEELSPMNFHCAKRRGITPVTA
jgi:hypothetical protein